METMRLQTVIGQDGKVRLEVPCGLPPGPAEVVVTISAACPAKGEVHWLDILGVGSQIWKDEEAQAYVNRLRDEWGK